MTQPNNAALTTQPAGQPQSPSFICFYSNCRILVGAASSAPTKKSCVVGALLAAPLQRGNIKLLFGTLVYDFAVALTLPETRAPYVPPRLEAVGRFAFVTGCSVAGGCLPINSSLETKMMEGL